MRDLIKDALLIVREQKAQRKAGIEHTTSRDLLYRSVCALLLCYNRCPEWACRVLNL